MIRCGAPWAFQKFHCTQFLNCNTAPVRRRTGWLQTTLALSAVLIAQNPKVPLLIPPQPVWTKPPMPVIVYSRQWTSALYRCPDETIDIFYRLNCTERCTHTLRIPLESAFLIL